jgi:phytochrome B
MLLLYGALDGQDSDKFPFSFFNRHGKYVEALLTANKRTDADGVITGVFCFLQIASVELLQVSLAS